MKNPCRAFPALIYLFAAILHAQDSAPIESTADLVPPVQSTSDHIGGLRSYGPVEINDVTGKATVTLPRIGPSELLSIQPRLRTNLKFDPPKPPGSIALSAQTDALGALGSIGWGYFRVIFPGDQEYRAEATSMTHYHDGRGSADIFYRDYLFQDHRPGGNDQFTFQNMIDDRLRRMTWQL